MKQSPMFDSLSLLCARRAAQVCGTREHSRYYGVEAGNRGTWPWDKKELTQINGLTERSFMVRQHLVGVDISPWRENFIKHLGFIIGIAGAVITGDASAQSVSLTGTYQCVRAVPRRNAGLCHAERARIKSFDGGWRAFACVAGLVLAGEPDLGRYL